MIVAGVPDGATLSADVGIVGGGPAGIALSLRLASEHGLRVCLLESGGLEFDPRVQELADVPVVGIPTPLQEASIRALGGSSWSWGGVCTPAESIAFEQRSWIPGGGWPIRQEDLDRYQPQALALCGIAPEERRASDIEAETAFQASGIDGRRLCAVPVYQSRPVRFGAAYRPDMERATTLAVHLDATITRLECIDGRIAAASGRSNGHPFRLVARSFVLAAGAIQNARLLLESGLGGVPTGRYYMDHPRVVSRFRVRPGDTPLWRLIGGGRLRRQQFFRIGLADRTQRAERLLAWHANIEFGYAGQLGPAWLATQRLAIAVRSPWNESPYFQSAGGGRLRVRAKDLVMAVSHPDRSVIGTLAAVTQHPALRRFIDVWSSTEQAPDPSNRVELIAERDALGMRRARVHWNVGPLEERTHRRARELMLEELEKVEPGIAEAQIGDSDGWPNHIATTWHQLGTTRMHDDPALGVVDRDCRVHGISNLYAAGGSVFPVGGSTSPTLMIVQLSLRLADHLGGVTRQRPTVDQPVRAASTGVPDSAAQPLA